MKILFLLSLCLFFTSNKLHSQVKVTVTNNNDFYGVIAEESADTLKLYSTDKLILIIPKKNILMMEQVKCYIKQHQSQSYYGRFSSFSEKGITMECEDGAIRQFDFWQSNLSFEGSFDMTYPFLGITIMTPGILNLNFGYYVSDNFGVAISAGVGAWAGGQFNVLYSFDRNVSIDHNIGLCIGYHEQTYGNRNEWKYVGLTYDFNYRGFFVQPGISIGQGYFKNPMYLLQLGYVYRFND